MSVDIGAPAAGMKTQDELPAERAKILLVDDDSDNLLALQAVLEPLDQELLLAQSGTSALRLCLDHDFAAILLDVRMPEIDGFETAELIRSRKRSSQTPILFLTGYRSDEQLFRGYDLGAVDFLFKPIIPEVLKSKVRVFVELSRGQQMLRRQADALARTEQKFRAVLEAAPDAMIITDTDGILRLANSRTDTLFGYDRERLIGSNVTSFIPNWLAPELRFNGEAKFGTALPEIRLEGICSDGRRLPIETTCSAFETDEGVFITTAVRDATEKVQAEERIRRINADLERRVADRTVELTRSNDALRQFAWAASHDLQEPVRMVLAYTQWVKRSAAEKLSAQELERLSWVHQNATHLETLLTDLRQYIFISESDEDCSTMVDCNEVLENVKQCLQGIIHDFKATIEAGPLPQVRCTEILLVQILQNLISNSIKYRSDADPIINVSAERTPEGWIFSVQDNGIGIDGDKSEYIFGVFKRLHGRQYSGTGIGLAICKAAAERMGGRIWVKPSTGPGTTFQFLLPCEAVS
ncbi:MAG TPA: ATP-binding protein [Bryobacteraceae bacterium]|nr:ATP-binding protein [Bryobacteraceae bacterium]